MNDPDDIGTAIRQIRAAGHLVLLRKEEIVVTPHKHELAAYLQSRYAEALAFLRREATTVSAARTPFTLLPATPPAATAKGAQHPQPAPLPHPNTTPVPDVFFDEIAPALNERELRIMLYLIRRTYGFKKQEDRISIGQFATGIMTQDGRQLDHGTGMNRSSVIRALKSLERRGLIEAAQVKTHEHGNEASRYRLVLKSPSGSTDTP